VNLGSDGQPSGTVTRRTYDERGRQIAVSYFTTAGAPTTLNGHHREQREYDMRGRRTSTAYFGVNGEPVLNNGVHERRYVTNRYGSRIEDRAFGVNGEPVPMAVGRTHHLIRDSHDERSLQTENAFFDIADRPTTDQYGVSIYRLENDPRGLRVRQTYFGPNGAPVAYDGKYWRIEFDNDAAGLPVAQRAYNAEGALFDAPSTGPQQAYVYDRFGRRIEQRNLGINGEFDPTALRALIRIEYDDRGRVVRTRNFGVDGQPMNHRTEGWAVTETTYDPVTGTGTTVRYNAAGRRIS
jgi:YD repeat-containing protein